MKVLGVSYNKISGPDATASYKIEFIVDESQREGVLELAKSLRKGSELLLLVFNVKTEEKEIDELVTEKPAETRTRLFKRMHAMLNDIAADKRMKPAEIKKILRDFLIKKKYIKTSTKELNINGLAAAIFYLNSEFEK